MNLLIFAGFLDTILFLVHGFALKSLWNWFVVPWLNLPSLGIGTAIGITLVVSLLTRRVQPKSEVGLKDQLVEGFSQQVGYALISLVIGFIAHQFA